MAGFFYVIGKCCNRGWMPARIANAILGELAAEPTLFYGWYLKCQSKEYTLAVIPAVHQSERKRTCSIQICFQGGSLMLSVADIPIAGFYFTGVICAVLWQGREYRLATYLGARAVRIRNRMVCIVQGDLKLEAGLLERNESPLKAPTMGDMVRIIHESAACRAAYQFRKGNQTIFAFETDRASFEYEYPE